MAAPEGKYRLPARHYLFRIHLDKAPGSVRVNGRRYSGGHYDSEVHTLIIAPAASSRKDITISVVK
jgi:hypothetical protein